MPHPRRAVITGLGLVSPLGLDLATNWHSLRAGRSGVRPIAAYDASALPVRFGGTLEGFDARDFVDKKDRKALKMMSRSIQVALAGARRALDDGGLAAGSFDPERCGVSFGAATMPGDLSELGAAAHA